MPTEQSTSDPFITGFRDFQVERWRDEFNQLNANKGDRILRDKLLVDFLDALYNKALLYKTNTSHFSPQQLAEHKQKLTEYKKITNLSDIQVKKQWNEAFEITSANSQSGSLLEKLLAEVQTTATRAIEQGATKTPEIAGILYEKLNKLELKQLEAEKQLQQLKERLKDLVQNPLLKSTVNNWVDLLEKYGPGFVLEELIKKSQELGEKNAEIFELTRNFNLLKSQYDSVSKENLELKEELVRSKQQIEELTRKLADETAQNVELQGKLEASNLTIQQRDAKLKDNEITIKANEQRIQELEGIIKLKDQEIESFKENELKNADTIQLLTTERHKLLLDKQGLVARNSALELENTTLKQEIKQLRSEIEELRKRISELETKLVTKTEEAARLTAELSQKEQSLQDALSEAVKLQVDLDREKQENLRLNEQLSNAQERAAGLEQRVTTAEDELRTKEEELAAATSKNSELQSVIRQTTAEKDKINAELVSARSKISNLEQENASLSKELLDKEAELLELQTKQADGFVIDQQKIKDLEGTLNFVRAKYNQALGELLEAQKRITALEEENARLTELLKKSESDKALIKKELDAVNEQLRIEKDAHQAIILENKSLQGGMNHLRDALAEVQDSNRELEQLLDQASVKARYLEKTIEAHNNTISSQVQQIESLMQENAEKQKRIDSSQKDEDTINRLRAEMEANGKLIAELKSNNLTLTQENTRLNGQLTTAREEISALNESIKKLQVELDGKQDEIIRLNSSLEEKTQQHEQAIKDVANLTLQLDKERKHNAELESLLQQKEKELIDLKDTNPALAAKEIESLREQIAKNTEQHREMENNLLEANRKLSSSQEELAAAKREIAILHSALKEALRVIKDLKEQLRKKDEKISELTAEIEKLKTAAAQNAEIERQKQALEKEKEALQKEKEDAERRNPELEQKARDLEEKMLSKDAEHRAETERQKQELEREKEALQKAKEDAERRRVEAEQAAAELKIKQEQTEAALKKSQQDSEEARNREQEAQQALLKEQKAHQHTETALSNAQAANRQLDDQLTKQLEEFRQYRAKAEQDLKASEASVAQATTTIANLQGSLSKLQSDNAALRTEKEQLSTRLENLDKDLKAANRELVLSQEEIRRLNKELASSKEEQGRLQEEVLGVTAQKLELEQKIQKLSDEQKSKEKNSKKKTPNNMELFLAILGKVRAEKRIEAINKQMAEMQQTFDGELQQASAREQQALAKVDSISLSLTEEKQKVEKLTSDNVMLTKDLDAANNINKQLQDRLQKAVEQFKLLSEKNKEDGTANQERTAKQSELDKEIKKMLLQQRVLNYQQRKTTAVSDTTTRAVRGI